MRENYIHSFIHSLITDTNSGPRDITMIRAKSLATSNLPGYILRGRIKEAIAVTCLSRLELGLDC